MSWRPGMVTGWRGPIHVCSYARLHQTVRASAANHVLSLVSAGLDLVRPPNIPASNHLDIRITGPNAAKPQDVEQIVDFVGRWSGDLPLVVHCSAGKKRSTAAAFIALCVVQPNILESEHAVLLRRASPTAWPNLRLIQLADDFLEREGRMSRAINDIGPGEEAPEAAPFVLAVQR